ncbi:hypothetical protein TNCV_4960681 [Trichonephila clavipes]|uniref:Uncharacterized protein n=1 Tax=Trichonephila clavipes TaxID=2585209 RepID=A0A8X6SVI7_TRICX|nr:hypothetical protein TNCV_4960681 [Trichonephila clavipes]
MDSLARQIQEMSLQVAELTRERNSSRHQRYSSDRRRSHSRSRSVNRGSGICYYHRRYKEQAHNRLFLLDRKSGQKFLIDSGSEICVIPPSPTMNKSPQSNFSLFAANNTKIPAYVHHIITTGPPVTARPRRLHPKLYDAVKVEFEFLLARGIIRPSKSPWSSPLHVEPKSDSTVRPVGDYRQLNSVTEFDSYPMPYLNDFAHALHGKRIFSKIDIFKAFHQIPIAECDIPKTAVTTPWGLYEYTHLCFNLVNAPQTFMRFMHEVLRGLPFCFAYLDDILCYSENAEEHRSHLRTIFQRLSSYGLKLNISKCVFGVTELIFLGHLITPDGIKPLPDKVQAVLDYKQPETVGSLRKFLGLLNFYRRFLPKAAEQQCKQALAEAALLAHPSPSAPLALHVDASDYAIEPTTVNSLLSTRLSDTFDICWKLEISVFTDHKPLTYAFRQKSDKCSPRQIRQLDFISQFTTNIVHIPGSVNIAADVLSRVSAITFPSQIDYDCIAETQQTDQELHTLIASGTSLELKKAKPLKDITAEAVAEAFFSSWVSRFGTPAILTTDRGRQFESSLFKALSKLLGVQKCGTTGYHPQANGMIEELHLPLKSAIKCHATERWTEVLPIILLGLRASLKEDILCTPAELVFGTTIRLPGEMFDSSKPDDDVVNFVSKLKSHMQSLHPKPPKHHGKRPVFIHPGLLEATHVFLRRDMLRRPLQQPYDGPFKVLQRKDKVFFLVIYGKRVSVSIDRCKPAFFLNTEDLQLPQTKNETPATVEPNATASTPATVESDPTASTPTQPSTRSGSKVHLPTRYR